MCRSCVVATVIDNTVWTVLYYLCYCEAQVCSSSVSIVYVVRLHIFSKAALQKRGSIEPNEPPLDPPLVDPCKYCTVLCT